MILSAAFLMVLDMICVYFIYRLAITFSSTNDGDTRAGCAYSIVILGIAICFNTVGIIACLNQVPFEQVERLLK